MSQYTHSRRNLKIAKNWLWLFSQLGFQLYTHLFLKFCILLLISLLYRYWFRTLENPQIDLYEVVRSLTSSIQGVTTVLECIGETMQNYRYLLILNFCNEFVNSYWVIRPRIYQSTHLSQRNFSNCFDKRESLNVSKFWCHLLQAISSNTCHRKQSNGLKSGLPGSRLFWNHFCNILGKTRQTV